VSETADFVVAGAGHNSLITAAYLAKAGYECLVLEAQERVGGNTATEELTGPGIAQDSCSSAHVLIQASPVIRDDELGLISDHGLSYLRPDPVCHFPFPDGESLTIWCDLEATCDELARLSPRDADAYRRLIADYDEVRGAFGRSRNTPAGRGPALDVLLAELPRGGRWRRIAAESAWDVVAREFEHPHVRAAMLWLAMATVQPPDRPGTGPLVYSIAYGRQAHSWTIPKGGSAALPEALMRVVEAHGGHARTGTPVTGLVIEDGRCAGVEAANGDRYLARHGVVSTIHPKHLVEMAQPEAWGEDFRWGVETWKPGLTLFAAYYATTAPPVYRGASGELTSVAAGIATSPATMLRLGAEFEAGQVAADPWLLIVNATAADPSRAPEGVHTLKVLGIQPYELNGGPERWDEIKDEVAAAQLEQLRAFCPNLTGEVILASYVSSPLDLERRNAHNWHGTCHGGDLAPSQSGSLRPVPGWAEHRTPIPGLYQTGATTHPGGSVSGAPGRNAAQVILEDLGRKLADVVESRAGPQAAAGHSRASS
jgi:phytoene dehydrogenase-like protein